jgi:hypothetical protein
MLSEAETPDGGSRPGPTAEHRHLSGALDEMTVRICTERVDLQTINQLLGRRSIGALLLVLALPMWLPIPAPGLSVAFGIPLVIVSAQLLVGRRSAWLPSWLGQRSIGRAELLTLVEKANPKLRTLERITRPRLAFLAGDWAMIPVGGACLILALIITLPIPLGHMVPGIAISLLALGIIERDGLAIGIGLLAAIVGIAIVILASTGLIVAVRAWLPP